MSHWLEEAESRKEMVESHSAVDVIKKKKKDIQENYAANSKLYENFLKELESLAERVNSLPTEYREDYGKINFNSKDSKLDNHLFYLSTSRRVHKRIHSGLFTYFKKYTFKHIRVAYFTIAREMGMFDIELKEKFLLRKRINPDDDRKHKIRSSKKRESNRKDFVFRLSLEQVNSNTALQIVDWLAYRQEMETISFFNQKLHSL